MHDQATDLRDHKLDAGASDPDPRPNIAVVIPCYRVRSRILDVIRDIGPEVARILVVDDACPESSGALVEAQCPDRRVRVLRHDHNQGVGAAMITGYRAALADGATIVVKLDGDGQMDPGLIPSLVAALLVGEADYAKGNRFYSRVDTRGMPAVRLLGNALLSFMTKLSSGYWSIFDPTNGFTAIHRNCLELLHLNGLARRYFFESDMLIKLGEVRAVVIDVRMMARYGSEVSNLKVGRVLLDFLWRHVRGTIRRIVYAYYVRDFSLASLNLLVGLPAMVFGGIYGIYYWWQSIATGVPVPTGTVMVAVLPIVLGFQMVLFFFAVDIANEPSRPLQDVRRLRKKAMALVQTAGNDGRESRESSSP